MWLRQVAVCGGVPVVRRGVGLQCVLACCVSCWYLVGSTGYVNCRVAVLCCVSLCACVVLRVSWCCFVSRCPVLCGALGSIWCWVLSGYVMWCGGESCGVSLWCVALWFVASCCFVVVDYGGFRWVFVLRRCVVAVFVVPFVVVWRIIGVFCWYVSCASLLRCVAPYYVLLCSMVTSYGSCFVSWRYAWCVVVRCLGALRCTLMCGVGHCHAVLCVVTPRFVVLCSMLCSVMAYRCLVVCFGVVYLVGGLVVLNCVSLLRGVV